MSQLTCKMEVTVMAAENEVASFSKDGVVTAYDRIVCPAMVDSKVIILRPVYGSKKVLKTGKQVVELASFATVKGVATGTYL